jgi:hypothetical protein
MDSVNGECSQLAPIPVEHELLNDENEQDITKAVTFRLAFCSSMFLAPLPS